MTEQAKPARASHWRCGRCFGAVDPFGAAQAERRLP